MDLRAAIACGQARDVDNQDVSMTKADFASAFYRQGVEAMDDKRWGLALAQLRRCVRLFPDNVMSQQLAEKCSDKLRPPL